MRRIMHRVDEHQSASVARQLCNFSDRIDRADGVRSVTHGDEFCFRSNFPLEVVQIEAAIGFADVHLTNHHAFLFQGAPRRHVGVVIQCRYHDFIARLQLTPDGARQREGDGGHVLAENDFVLFAMEKIRHRRARGGDCRVVAAAGQERSAGIRVRVQEIVLNCVHDLFRHLRPRRAIQKSSWMAVHLQLKRRKLRPHPRAIERFARRFVQSWCTHFSMRPGSGRILRAASFS